MMQPLALIAVVGNCNIRSGTIQSIDEKLLFSVKKSKFAEYFYEAIRFK